MKTNKGITARELRRLVIYDPQTGEMRWRIGGMGRGRVAGKLLGTTDEQEYRRVCIRGIRYKCHRLAWLYMTGRWPQGEVDHIDGVPANNAWSNLRDVDRITNQQNQRRAQRSNRSTGLLGVKRLNTKKPLFMAQITTNGQRAILGYFDTPEKAHDAYVEAKRKIHRGCTI